MRIGAHTLFAISLLTALSLAGCEEMTLDNLPDGRAYFPVEVGSEWEYRYDSIIFDDAVNGNILDTFSGFILERVVEKIESLSGDSLSVLERSFRKSADDPWQVTDIWTLSTNERYAFRNEENLNQVKMIFPLRETSTWDPTGFFDETVEVQVGTETIQMFTNWDGRVGSMMDTYATGDLQFDDVLEVFQADDDNAIERRYVRERYAAGIGLVSKTDTILDSRCKRIGDLLPCLEDNGTELVTRPWIEIGEKGYILRQEIIRFN